MSDYKTTDYIIGIVYSLLGSITKPKYLKTKPSKSTATEYVVINSLPVNANVMQKCYVNVNYHVKDIDGGPGIGLIPDATKLEAGSALILAALKQVSTTSYLIDLESQETIREEQLGEHYSNLRFSFKNINN
ncbi:MAG TPA: hypothetical protein VI911_06035 [Patescibacteria group bacterium]|nr:hypothetical protein [Patescibacteria group bacterium]